MAKGESKPEDLATRIRRSDVDHPIEATLTTNERVLARITDGIYRQPASALRELISNAYDADAHEVVILTDAPRFSSIVVRDDGIGLSPETLKHLIQNIGGSAKRTKEGGKLEITSKDDPDRSPGGRKLIGKLGIGLFAVSQFTRHFMILSKQKGDDFRTIADITLGPVTSDERLHSYDRNAQPEIETGKARIHCEPVSKADVDSQGTEIRLLDLLPRTQAELASEDWWAKLDFQKADDDGEITIERPHFHIGRSDKKHKEDLVEAPSLPWKDEQKPGEKFLSLVSGIRELASSHVELVDLEKVCDRYLQTLWTLALSAPIEYVGPHPFDLTGDDAQVFELQNAVRGQAKLVSLNGNATPRAALGLKTREPRHGDKFSIEIDGVKLARPIVFRDQPKASAAVKNPLLFVGKCREVFKGKPAEMSGGPLDFEAYLFWTPKVIPTQHQGVLVRVGGASGALFDRTFMGYQVSEQTRLRQITAEIFIREGFDGAINLDRESFNFSHPHYQFLVKWLHSAIRQLTNKHKEVGKAIRTERVAKAGAATREALDKKVSTMLEARGIDEMPEVALITTGALPTATQLRKQGKLVFRKSEIVPPVAGQRNTGAKDERAALIEKKTIAIAQILETWGLLKGLKHSDQERLLREIAEIMQFEGD